MADTNWLEQEGTILIVDDLESNRFLLKNILGGYCIFEAEDASEALAIMGRQNIDLVLLDIMMPNLSGYEVCKVIKGHDLWRSTQVIFISSLNDVDSRIQAIAAGADDYISRPFHMHELLARVKSSLRTKQYYEHMESLDTILFMLASIVESKDKYTEEHLKRMANYAERLAQLAGLSARQQGIVRYGAILHDIGKIGIPDSILGKPDKLTREEYEIIKTHTILGAQIVQSMRIGKELGLIIRGHHEQWDGSGYPDGLADEQISIGARIVSVCDVYDAITTKRSYKPVFSQQQAIEELTKFSARQFEPRLVDIFVKNIHWITADNAEQASENFLATVTL